MQQEPSEARAALPRFFTLEMFMFTVAVLSGLVLMWNIVAKDRNVAVLLCAGAIFTLSIVVVIRLLMDGNHTGSMVDLTARVKEGALPNRQRAQKSSAHHNGFL